MQNDGAVLLSEVPGRKLRLVCSECGLRRQYDIGTLLERTGDWKMPFLIDELARRNGCQRKPAPSIYEQCRLMRVREEPSPVR